MMDYSMFNPLNVLPFSITPGLVQSDAAPYTIHGQPAFLYGTPQHFLPVPHFGKLVMHAVGGASAPISEWSSLSAYPASAQMGILVPELQHRHQGLPLLEVNKQPSRLAVPSPSTSPAAPNFWDVLPTVMNSPTVKGNANASQTCNGQLPNVGTTGTLEKGLPANEEDCCTSSSSPVPAKKRCPRVSKCLQGAGGEGRKPEKRHPYTRKRKPSLEDITNQALERYYSQTAFPDIHQVNHIANHLCMTLQDVSDWFQKRRFEQQLIYESHSLQTPNYAFPGYPLPTLGYFTPMPAIPMTCGQPRHTGRPLER